jgi:3-hydroxybutyrate dehydrogenase
MTEGISLAGKTALITGSTSGIGLGLAQGFAAAGANVVMNGLGSQADIDTAVAAVDSSGAGKVEFADADLRRPANIEAMIREVEARFERIDVLVNNAGVQHVAPVDEFPADKWDDILAINLSSAFHTIRSALPAMKAAGWGRVINIASAHALTASPYKAAYVSAKHGMAGLTKTVALEVAKTGITVNAIAPGFVDTPLVEKQLEDAARAHRVTREQVFNDVVVASQPSGRLVGVDEIAALAVYLCSPQAQSMTGSILPVDGGWTAS